MALQYCISTGAVSATSVIKTAMEIPSASTLPFVIYLMEVTSSATTAGFVTVNWWTFTTSGTGGSIVTPQKIGTDQSLAALIGQIRVANTGEPGSPAIIPSLPQYYLPLPGMYSILYPYGREPYQPISQSRCIRVQTGSSTAVSVCINVYIEQ